MATDKARMNYLSLRYALTGMGDAPTRDKLCRIFFYGKTGTLRQAIDAAIKAERRAGRKRG